MIGKMNNIWQRISHFKGPIALFLGLADIEALFAKEALFFRFRVIF